MPAYYVENRAQERFDSLMGIVKLVRQERDSYRGVSQPVAARAENEALFILLCAFEVAATTYFEKGKELLGANVATAVKAAGYDRILKTLEQHMLLLQDLARPPLRVKTADTKPELRSLLTRFVNILARRANMDGAFPFLLVSETYQFIRFPYLDLVAVLGVPIDLLVSQAWQSYCILWHEVAGFRVAQIKDLKAENPNGLPAPAVTKSRLDEWAFGLNPLVWNHLLDDFTASFLADSAATVTPNDHGTVGATTEGTNKIVEALRLAKVLDVNPSDSRIDQAKNWAGFIGWRSAWLAEFLEDLYGVEAVGGPMVESLADALMAHYGNPASNEPDTGFLKVGDSTHPPGLLRLLVAVKYLETTHPELAGDDPRKAAFDPSIAIGNIRARYGTLADRLTEPPPPGWGGIPEEIVMFYRKPEVISVFRNSGHLQGTAGLNEREVARALGIASLEDEKLQIGDKKELDGQNLLGKPTVEVKHANSIVDVLLPEPTIALPFAPFVKNLGPGATLEEKQGEVFSGIRTKVDVGEFVTRINGCQEIQALLAVKFAEVDDAKKRRRPPTVYPPS